MPLEIHMGINKEDWARLHIKLDYLAKGSWINKAEEEGGAYMVAANERGVAEKGLDIHNRLFAKLSTAYLQRPLARGGRGGEGHPILIRNAGSRVWVGRKGQYRKIGKFGAPGQMLHSVFWRRSGKHKITIQPSDGRQALLGMWHQKGKGTLPKREWLGFRRGDTDKVMAIFHRHYGEAVKSRG